jgi:hypothetical protein
VNYYLKASTAGVMPLHAEIILFTNAITELPDRKKNMQKRHGEGTR